MTREEAKRRLLNIERCTPIHTREDARDFEALDMAIQALSQEPCDDAISRQAGLDAISRIGLRKCSTNEIQAVDECLGAIEALPSVTQTGKWIEKDGFDGDVYYDCSVCGESWTTIEGTPWDNEWNYCPNCGCRMVEPQESEVRNEVREI